MPGFRTDLRHALRVLLGSPGTTLAAVLTLALGIGATTSIFSVVHGLLFSPLPYPDQQRLVYVWSTHAARGVDEVNVSPADFRDWEHGSTSFDAMLLMTGAAAPWVGESGPEELNALACSPTLLRVLGLAPVLGAGFGASPDTTVLVSHEFWLRRLGGEPAVVGRPMRIGDRSYLVGGVLPPGATIVFGPTDVFLPLDPEVARSDVRGTRAYQVLARVKPGVSLARAHADLAAVAARLEQLHPATNLGYSTRLEPVAREIYGDDLRAGLLVLSLAVALVLLIACVNVANLLLARAAGRTREIGVRTALGASRTRLLRQLLTEAVLLAVAGGLCGLLVAAWSIDVLGTLALSDVPRSDSVRLDAGAVAFALGVSVATGLLFGLAPAWQAIGDAHQASLQDGGRTATSGASRRLLRALVVSELALALMLLASGGLLIRTLQALSRVDPGFEIDRVLSFYVALPPERYPEPARRLAFYEAAVAELEALPGVERAAIVQTLPLDGSNSWTRIVLDDRPREEGDEEIVGHQVVSPGFFATMGIPIVAGRDFAAGDAPGAPPVAIVNETMARRYWPGDPRPLGRRIATGGQENRVWWTVVGVVADIRHRALELDPRPELFLPFAQREVPRDMVAVVRTAQEAMSLAPAARAAVARVDPAQPVYLTRSLTQVVDQVLAQPRAGARLMGLLSVAALLLAAVGIYGVLSFFVSQRTREIGVRMALGADAPTVLRLVLGQVGTLVAAGLAIGVAGAIAGGRLLVSLLYGVSSFDPLTLIATAWLLAAVAFAATLLPARRAIRIDPVEALRAG